MFMKWSPARITVMTLKDLRAVYRRYGMVARYRVEKGITSEQLARLPKNLRELMVD